MKEVNPVALRLGRSFFWGINCSPLNIKLQNYNVYMNQILIYLIQTLLIERFKILIFYFNIHTTTAFSIKNITFIFYKLGTFYRKFVKHNYTRYFKINKIKINKIKIKKN